jgi:hypothetical protein
MKPIFQQLTPRETARLERPIVVQLVKKFPAFYGTQSFITVIITAPYWFLT